MPLPAHSKPIVMYPRCWAVARCCCCTIVLWGSFCTSDIMAMRYVHSVLYTRRNDTWDREHHELLWCSAAVAIQLLLASLNPMYACYLGYLQTATFNLIMKPVAFWSIRFPACFLRKVQQNPYKIQVFLSRRTIQQCIVKIINNELTQPRIGCQQVLWNSHELTRWFGQSKRIHCPLVQLILTSESSLLMIASAYSNLIITRD